MNNGGIIHSTDDLIEATGDYRGFFEEMKKTGNFVNLSRMHSKNLVNAKKSMDEGVSPVIIDNTNIKANEPKAFVVHALNIGFSDANIKIVDVGTGGLTAEALAKRNTHGVPVDKIESMIKAYNSTGPLTLKKILQTADMYKDSDVLYSAVVLDEKSKGLLMQAFRKIIPEDWKTYVHHMTIAFGKGVENKSELGKEVTLTVTKIGISDMAIAAGVEGYPSKNTIPHITLAINPNGGKPVISNEITDWKSVTPFKINGVVTEVKK